ncbi:glycosyltransferase [Halostagnicola kamekurae]|uniref:Glycosyl transferase 4-like domain-containing protein n=1 Tax=Halostagnicola kamekurae TaxID=619731 RepID=A0A1I6UG18_9EURY|nr:glycosyltransferase [Halostagnicola kamekurae]SFT00429.1 Glycosyl transferase 4-like domain-containing protein [Halostagnicola kamekurae]
MHVLILTTNEDAPFMNQQLAALERLGVSFTVRSVPGETGPGRSRSPLEYLKFFPTVVRESRNGYDLIHAHYGLTAPMALAQFRQPVVLSLWGTDVYGPGEPISRFCAPFCEEVVVMSAEMGRTLGRDCTVIPDGVNVAQFYPIPQAEARERVGWNEEGYDVLFPYSPDREVKNHPRARRVVRAVEEQIGAPVRLRTVYGVDHDEVVHYMNAADALLLTSESEGSPNSVKEAMACNVPVVAVDVGDVADRLDGVSPSTVATSDRDLIAGLRDILERGERSNGREAAAEISVERTAARMLETYERAVARKS